LVQSQYCTFWRRGIWLRGNVNSFAPFADTAGDSVFYYRIQSPVILIEFDHQRPANLARFAKNPDAPTQQHIHCVVRAPNGNDYGKDLLRQHYLTHPHES